MSTGSVSPTTQAAQPARFALSEDWLATLAGLAIVIVLALLVTGPAPQTVTLTAPAGEAVTASALPQNGFAVSAKLAGAGVPLTGAPLNLAAGDVLIFRCADDQIARQEGAVLPEGIEAADAARAQLVLVNECGGEAVLTYKTGNVIPWPVFRLFGR